MIDPFLQFAVGIFSPGRSIQQACICLELVDFLAASFSRYYAWRKRLSVSSLLRIGTKISFKSFKLSPIFFGLFLSGYKESQLSLRKHLREVAVGCLFKESRVPENAYNRIAVHC